MAKGPHTIRLAEVFPPGEFLADEMAERGWTKDDLGRLLQMDAGDIDRLLVGEKPVTVSVAERLGAILGTSVDVWLNLQAMWRQRNR